MNLVPRYTVDRFYKTADNRHPSGADKGGDNYIALDLIKRV